MHRPVGENHLPLHLLSVLAFTLLWQIIYVARKGQYCDKQLFEANVLRVHVYHIATERITPYNNLDGFKGIQRDIWCTQYLETREQIKSSENLPETPLLPSLLHVLIPLCFHSLGHCTHSLIHLLAYSLNHTQWSSGKELIPGVGVAWVQFPTQRLASWSLMLLYLALSIWRLDKGNMVA